MIEQMDDAHQRPADSDHGACQQVGPTKRGVAAGKDEIMGNPDRQVVSASASRRNNTRLNAFESS